MIAKYCTCEDLQKALEVTNASFSGNIRFKDISQEGRRVRFTLTVVSSKGPGGRLGFPNSDGKQRHIAAACWHVHGTFFDALLDIAPGAVINTANAIVFKLPDGQTIGNWQDSNIGSQYRPLYYSEACEC